MKKIFLSIVIASVANVALASPVGIRQAKDIARAALIENMGGTARRAAIANMDMKVILQDELLAEPAWYVITPASGEGFVIVSGDDSEDEVIGYSTESIVDAASMPPALKALLDNYSGHISLVRQGLATPTAKEEDTMADSQPARIPSSVSSLCKCQWSQGAPFNNLCPITDGENCLVGCVALSMAQVMYYYQYPVNGTGTVRCMAAGAQVSSMDLSTTTFDYANMLADYTGEYSEEEANAVATLCLACGYATNMQYGLSISGTYMEDQCSAFINKFNYSSSTRIIVRTGALENDTKWKKRLKEELAAGRPIIITAYTESNYGHNFICDGYSSLKFHINWGWGPPQNGVGYNGNYNILTLTPYGWGESFTKNQQFLIGIKPAVEGEDIHTQYFVAANDSVTNYNANGNTISFTLPAFTNATASNVNSSLYYIITDINNNKVGECNICNLSIKGKKDSNSQDANITIPSDLADGKYYLSLELKPNNSDAFQKIESWYNKTNLCLTINDGQVSAVKALTDDEMASEMATGIEIIKSENVKSEEYYNIAGQKVNNPQHGLFIKNGKKILFK